MNPENINPLYEKIARDVVETCSDKKVYAESFDDEELERVNKENTASEDMNKLIDSFTEIIGSDPEQFSSAMLRSPFLRSFCSGLLDAMLQDFLS